MRGIGDNLNKRWKINHSYTKKSVLFYIYYLGLSTAATTKITFFSTEILQLRKLHLNVIRKYNKT